MAECEVRRAIYVVGVVVCTLAVFHCFKSNCILIWIEFRAWFLVFLVHFVPLLHYLNIFIFICGTHIFEGRVSVAFVMIFMNVCFLCFLCF